MEQAKSWTAGLSGGESADTTHVTVADAMGNVVSATQTINGLFGACVQIPGTGMIANNYMFNFDPHPGRALSIAPGVRVNYDKKTGSYVSVVTTGTGPRTAKPTPSQTRSTSPAGWWRPGCRSCR